MSQGRELRVLGLEEARVELGQRLFNPAQDDQTRESVKSIIVAIAQRGDQALIEYSKQFDGVELGPDELRLDPVRLEEAVREVESSELGAALRLARSRIKEFHERQLEKSWLIHQDDALLGQLVNPLAAVGLYVPGGTASYPSTVLMNAIPAQVAGVKRIVVTTPAKNLTAAVLYAIQLSGITEVYQIGGAQAIAALALGTETIKPVDKICGPGNRFVAEAKRQVFGLVAIDMVAGPSEIMILADRDSDPELVVRDLFSQAEHDPDAGCVLVSDSLDLVSRVNHLIPELLRAESRGQAISEALEARGLAILVQDRKEIWEIVNLYAPEHLEILAEIPLAEVLSGVKNAGAIFYGPYSPEPLGDYIAGPNHTLPTSGTARFASPLGVYDFQKRSSLIAAGPGLFAKLVDPAASIARSEGLLAHEASLLARKGTSSRKGLLAHKSIKGDKS